MAIDVKIPPMGESITTGILASWHVADGDTVERDQAIYELETDKITSEGIADSDGVIKIVVEAGAEVSIGQVVATIDPEAAPAAKTPDSEAATEKSTAGAGSSEQSPAVRRLAEETDIDPESVTGTGKAGRVTKGDMLKAQQNQSTETAPAEDRPAEKRSPSAPASPDPQTSAGVTAARTARRKMTPLRARIAERLVRAKNETAMLTTFNEVDMTAIRTLRARYQEDFVKKYGIKLGLMSFFVKAAVHALKEIPAINAQLDGDHIIENHYHDIGVAVSTDRGLMVPVLRDCDSKNLAEIENAIADYAKRAREGKITLPDLDGGVFTITNGGIFGSLLSTPILNPPQSAILGMHAIQERPVAVAGEVVVRPMMYLALSYDHQIVDGREAVTFLVKMKQVLEDPARFVLGI